MERKLSWFALVSWKAAGTQEDVGLQLILSNIANIIDKYCKKYSQILQMFLTNTAISIVKNCKYHWEILQKYSQMRPKNQVVQIFVSNIIVNYFRYFKCNVVWHQKVKRNSFMYTASPVKNCIALNLPNTRISSLKQDCPNTQMHKYTNAQIYKCTNIQMHKYINAQIYKYTSQEMTLPNFILYAVKTTCIWIVLVFPEMQRYKKYNTFMSIWYLNILYVQRYAQF